MAEKDLTFAEKIRTIGVVGLSSSPRSKRTVDDHGTHRVTTTEHSSNDRVDVAVTQVAPVKMGAVPRGETVSG